MKAAKGSRVIAASASTAAAAFRARAKKNRLVADRLACAVYLALAAALVVATH
jgi:hypothetical protein